MYDGSDWDGDPLTDDIWYVPHKFYSLSKLKVWINDPNENSMPAFQVTFKADPTKTSGWPDEVHTFGNTGVGYTPVTYEVDFTDQITEMATCVDDIWGSDPYADLERFKIKENGQAVVELGSSDYACDSGVSSSTMTVFTEKIIGFHARVSIVSIYIPFDTVTSIAMITDSSNCEMAEFSPASAVTDMTHYITALPVTTD